MNNFIKKFENWINSPAEDVEKSHPEPVYITKHTVGSIISWIFKFDQPIRDKKSKVI
jgi:hypothetical protein